MNRSVWSATCKNDNSADLYLLIMSLVTVGAQQTRNVIVTFSIGFKLVTLNLRFGKRLAKVYVLCRHTFDV